MFPSNNSNRIKICFFFWNRGRRTEVVKRETRIFHFQNHAAIVSLAFFFDKCYSFLFWIDDLLFKLDRAIQCKILNIARARPAMNFMNFTINHEFHVFYNLSQSITLGDYSHSGQGSPNQHSKWHFPSIVVFLWGGQWEIYLFLEK